MGGGRGLGGEKGTVSKKKNKHGQGNTRIFWGYIRKGNYQPKTGENRMENRKGDRRRGRINGHNVRNLAAKRNWNGGASKSPGRGWGEKKQDRFHISH